jgi:hypothetical protein
LPPQFWNKQTLSRLAFLAATIWIAHFFHSQNFGLYEDDYAFISPALGWNLSDLLHRTASVIKNWPQGRPIGFFLPPFLSFIGTHIGGLSATYLIAFGIITLNACLFYTLLKRVTKESTAFIGALAFCLFPADTTQPFLMHAFGLQTSLTFLLLASHTYLAGRRSLPYLIIAGALLTYESPFMVFLGMPLLTGQIKWNRAWRKEFIRHIVLTLVVLLIIIAIRIALGEQRAVENLSTPIAIPLKIIAGICIGPAVSLALFFSGPINTLLNWNAPLAIVFVSGWLILISAVCWRTVKLLKEKRHRPAAASQETVMNSPTSSAYTLPIVQLFLAACVFLGLAYMTSFTHFPPIATSGRGTSVHLAATFGGALLFACLCSVWLSAANAHRLKNLARLGFVVYFMIVIAYRFSIQLDFKQAWQNERSFWSSALENVPDLNDGTIVFVLDHDLPQTNYILSNSWADPIMLSQIFHFPIDWKTPPRLFVVQSDWAEHLIRDGDHFKWQVPVATWPTHWEILPNANVILLEMHDGVLIRRAGSIQTNGQDFELKPLTANLGFAKGPLYNYLTDQTNDQSLH